MEIKFIEIDMKKVNEFLSKLPKWEQAAENGYKPLTTLWQDFSIAERAPQFGEDPIRAIRETFKSAVLGGRDNYKFMTELALVLNHKLFAHYTAAERAKKHNKVRAYKHFDRLAREYNAAWLAVDNWCVNNLSEEGRAYYEKVTD
jgi:hypothetical protein